MFSTVFSRQKVFFQNISVLQLALSSNRNEKKMKISRQQFFSFIFFGDNFYDFFFLQTIF